MRAEAATHDLDGLVAAVRDLMNSQRVTVITFLTDFGLQDDFVGTCHGVIARIAPEARVIDVTHGIAPQAVLQGALVLRNTTRYMPVGVHLAVVDPVSAANRRAIAVRTRDGRVFVGPDNGLLMLAADERRDRRRARARRRALPPAEVSRTFHARDVFAPAAAHLAAGVADRRARAGGRPGDARARRGAGARGRPLADLRDGARGRPVRQRRDQHAPRAPRRARSSPTGDRVEVRLALDRYYAVVAGTFADAPPGELILYEDSYGLVTLAISRGNAARLTGVGARRRAADRRRVTARPAFRAARRRTSSCAARVSGGSSAGR